MSTNYKIRFRLLSRMKKIEHKRGTRRVQPLMVRWWAVMDRKYPLS
jgi:hypothetical protein